MSDAHGPAADAHQFGSFPRHESLNRQLAGFFAHWDIEVMGNAAESQEPSHFQSADLREGAALAYRLGRDALAHSASSASRSAKTA